MNNDPVTSTANDSLASETLNPELSSPELGFTSGSGATRKGAESGMVTAFALGHDDDLLPHSVRGPLGSYDREHVPETQEDGSVRFVVSKSSSNTVDFPVLITGSVANPEEWLRQAQVHTELSIAEFLDWQSAMRGRAQKTVSDYQRDLAEVFSIVVPDPALGYMRPVTLPDFLRPGHGARLVRALRAELDDLGVAETVTNRYLRSLRVLCRHVVAKPVVGSIDLTELYGVLVCPLNDGDVPKQRSKANQNLPLPGELAVIYESSFDWARSRPRWQYAALRSAVMLISSFESAMRGCEQCMLDLKDQVFDRRLPFPVMRNPIHLVDTKTGVERNVFHEPYGLEVINYWLKDIRPLRAPEKEGVFYPATGALGRFDRPMTSSAFSSSIGELLNALKERGLIDPQFTFHWARKTFATNYLEAGGNLSGLMARGGWTSASTLDSYVRAREESVTASEQRFLGALERRRRR